MKKYALIIHGGCGALSQFSEKEQKAFLKSLEKVIKRGEKYLQKGEKALDVVEKCVRLLEDDPIFNAGKGSVLNEKGEVEMDASIMCGKTMNTGAVAGVKSAKNPITVARKVMEKTNHVFLIGEGAEKFIRKEKIERKPASYFILPHRVAQLKKVKKEGIVLLDHDDNKKNAKLGTVGAVSFDIYGDLAAATSTGGMSNKMVGRTGDSALIGCGNFADNKGAGVSCTGRGEDFIKAALSRRIADLVELKGYKAKKASKKATKYFKEKVNGYGGFIMIDKKGNIGEGHTTEGLIRAYVKQGKKPVCKLF